MSRSKGILIGIIAFIVLIGMYIVSAGNTLVRMDEAVTGAWAQVENVYQRRVDLIPNLVNTVKGYAKHEKSTLEEVTRARASVGKVQVNNPGDLKAFEQSQNQLTSALSRLMVVVEKYPELKADRNFRDLQSQLEGTENRIATERRRFNELAQDFNTQVRVFPSSMVASFKGLKQRPYFQADAGAKTAPTVNFE